MKIGATELAKNKDNTEPITFVPKRRGIIHLMYKRRDVTITDL